MTKKLSLFSLVLLVVSAIDSMRNLPAAALFGSETLFFFSFAAIFFLIPTALVAAELAAFFEERGGIYHWIERAFGAKAAMVAIWLQWINTMVWYPTILSFIAGTLAYLIDPSLADEPLYLIAIILAVFWGMTVLNLRGLRVSSRLNTVFSLIGMILPLTFLLVLGATWFLLDEPVQISFQLDRLIPSFHFSQTWVSLTAIIASFVGMELAGVHLHDISNPRRNFPRALLFSGSFIFVSMLLGSLTIAAVLPTDDISLVAGTMQVFSKFFAVFHIEFLVPVLTVLIVIGTIGGLTSWLISPARGLLHAAEFGFLPSRFAKRNVHGVASRILIVQAVLVSLFCSLFLFVPSVNAFYWFLTALSTGLYLLMYILMFLAALSLHHRYKDRPVAFKVPGKTVGMWIVCLCGLFGCIITLLVGFIPPSYISFPTATYAWMIAMGNIVLLAPLLGFFYYQKKYNNRSC